MVFTTIAICYLPFRALPWSVAVIPGIQLELNARNMPWNNKYQHDELKPEN